MQKLWKRQQKLQQKKKLRNKDFCFSDILDIPLQAYIQTSMTQDIDVQFLDYVVKSLVDKPEEVKIDRTVDEMGVLLTLSVNAEDMGKIIGRSGNTAKAIRTLLRVVGMKHNARVNLKINEPEGGMRKEPSMKSVDQAVDDLKI